MEKKRVMGQAMNRITAFKLRGKNVNVGINYEHIGAVNIGNSRGGAEELSRLLSQTQNTVAQAAITEAERKEE